MSWKDAAKGDIIEKKVDEGDSKVIVLPDGGITIEEENEQS